MEFQDESLLIPPDLKRYFFPGEVLRHIEYIPERLPDTPLSAVSEMRRLAGVYGDQEIGENGPVLAALSLESATSANGDAPILHSYEALFGRDSLRAADDLLLIYPQLTRTTLLALARLQGLTYDPQKEEEPGRIIHESRDDGDPVRQQLTDTLGWAWPYYGSVDSTPQYIRALATYCKTSPEAKMFLYEGYVDYQSSPRRMCDSLELATDWLVRRLDSNPEGLLESTTASQNGIENQVWKDSWDAYHHHDGTLADRTFGVASIEVQSLAYDALLDAAELYKTTLGMPDESEQLTLRAARLRETIISTFWTEDKGGYFVLGTDRDNNGAIRQLNVRSSNMGHLLKSRLLDGDEPDMIRFREAIVTQLFSDEMLTPQGIRTLASDEIRYRPGAYHNGSVWIMDNFVIITGLRRQGYDDLADDLSERLLHTVNATQKFPEYTRGDNTPEPVVTTRVVDIWDGKRTNRIEQPPQEIQAWTVSAILAIQHLKAVRAQNEAHRIASIAEANYLQPTD